MLIYWYNQKCINVLKCLYGDIMGYGDARGDKYYYNGHSVEAV